MTLEEVNELYKYQSDLDKYGFNEVWAEPRLVNGMYKGDCEDYCILLKRNVPEFKDWDYYYCKLNGSGHCVLYKDGDVIDCNYKNVIAFDLYSKVYKVSEFKKYSKFTVWSKLIVGKVITWIC